MNLKLNLLKIAPVVTTIAVGVFAPIEMVNAASGSDDNYVAKATQQEVVKKSTAATGGHGQSTAATGSHGQSTAATIPEMLTSKKAQEIEFFSFLSIIGLSVVVPELFYRPQKEAQKLVIVEKNQAQGQNQAFTEKDLQQYESKDNQQSIQAELSPTRLINLSQETEATQENTESKKDLPNLKVVSDSPTPYTIPNKEISKIQTNGKIQLDNWSQPNRDAA